MVKECFYSLSNVPSAKAMSKFRANFDHPESDGFVANRNIAFRWQVLDVSNAWIETVLQPNCMLREVRRITVPLFLSPYQNICGSGGAVRSVIHGLGNWLFRGAVNSEIAQKAPALKPCLFALCGLDLRGKLTPRPIHFFNSVTDSPASAGGMRRLAGLQRLLTWVWRQQP